MRAFASRRSVTAPVCLEPAPTSGLTRAAGSGQAGTMFRVSIGPAQRRVLVAFCVAGLGCGAPAAPAAAPVASTSAAPADGAAAGAAPALVASADVPCSASPPAAFTWTADAGATPGAAPVRLGGPRTESGPDGSALCFDGVDDGLAFDRNPIAGMKEFTIQVLFRPDASGSPEAPSEQRFVHFEEGSTTTPESRRALIETRVVGEQWYLDTYLRAANGNKALIDAEKKHRVGRWYWVALTYAGGSMRHYIDGQLELEGAVPFEPLCAGRASLGVRLNRVSWFKGCLRELRVTPSVLSASELAAVNTAAK